MSTIIAYAVAFLLNIGAITPDEVNRTTDSLRVVERDGRTVVVSHTGTDIIIF